MTAYPSLGSVRRQRHGYRLWLVAVLLLASACRSLPFAERATPTPTMPAPSEIALPWPDVEARLQPATVLIEFALPQAGTYRTTGIAAAPGLVLTVVPPLEKGPPERVTVRPPGASQPQEAELLGASPCDGLAVVRVAPEATLGLAPLGNARLPDIGEDVLVYGHSSGNPGGPAVSVPAAFAGSRTDPRRGFTQLGVNVDLTGFTAGALLADRYGAVIGLLLPDGSFLAADQARDVAARLAEGRGLLWLGLGLSPHRNPEHYGTERGLVVLQASPGGPAAQAGIAPGMLLARIDETDIDSFAQVCTLLREHRQGDELRLELRQPDDTEIRILQTRLRIGEPAPSTPTEIGRQPNPRPARPALVTSWTFDRPEEAADWPTGSSQVGSGTVSGGRYAITLAQPNAFGLFQPLTVPPGTDQRITAVVSLPDEAGAGLVVRSSQDADGTRNLYLCAVVRTGGQLVATCSLAIVGQSAVLLPVTPLASLDPTTDPLTLEFEARSTHLVFRVAGQTVADLTDPLLGHGQAGLWVESFATAPVTVAFDEVTLEIVPR